MVTHRDVDRVGGATFGHVTGDAVGGVCGVVLSGQLTGVAGTAGFGIAGGSAVAAMWVVAGGAGEGFGVGSIAGGLEETVGRGGEFEFVVVARVRSVVEVESVVREGFAGAVRRDIAVIADDLARERKIRGFEVALEADFDAASGGEAGRIDDGLARGVGRVVTAGAVATLAVDAHRLTSSAGLRDGVVAKEALGIHFAGEAGMLGSLEAWGHRPRASFFRVPRNREFDEVAEGVTAEVAAGVFAGTEAEFQGLFKDVDGLAFGALLVAAEGGPIAGEYLAGGGVTVFEFWYRGGRSVGIRHAGFAPLRGNLCVAGGADFGIDVGLRHRETGRKEEKRGESDSPLVSSE